MVQQLLSKLYSIFIYLTGSKVLKKVISHQQKCFEAVAGINGYGIKINCNVISYEYHSLKSGRVVKSFSVYEVTGKCEYLVPDVLQQAMMEPVYLPRLVPSYVSDDYSLSVIVDAYLDIIIQKMK